jgi:hypothetical protein
MPFQIMCPQQHLLEVHEAQVGQQVQCPMCGQLLIVPMPPQAPGYAPGPPGYGPMPGQPGFPGQQYPDPAYQQMPYQQPGMYQQPGAYQQPAYQQPGPPAEAFPNIVTEEQEEAAPAEPEKPVDTRPPVVRIPCPAGHELQTPIDMVGQDALCPYCNVQFTLRYEDSLECKEQQAEAQRHRDEQMNKFWLKWSMIAGGVVVVSILGMILYRVFFATS